MNRFHQKCLRMSGASLLAAAALLFAPAASLVGAESAAPAQGAVQNISLEYTETTYQVMSVGLWYRTLDSVKNPFAKEPALGKGTVKRMALKVFPSEADKLNMIWVVDERKLFIDLNRNGDFTDDTNGLYVSPSGVADGGSARYADFKNISVTFQVDGRTRRGVFDFWVHAYGDQLSGTMSWRSCWQGKANFGGRDYQVGLIDPLGGNPTHLLLRRWDLHQAPFSVSAGTLVTLPVPKRVFVAGQTFEVVREDRAIPALVFSPVATQLGELTLSGKNISRLLLAQTDRSLVAVVDDPGTSVMIPIGDYTEPEVFLKSGKGEAIREKAVFGRSPDYRAFTVMEAKPVLLSAGGPLTNSVSAKVRGSVLAMDYELVGADGAKYRMLTQDSQHPPRVSVRKNGKEIHSGQFAYG